MGRIAENFKRKTIFEKIAYFVSGVLIIASIVIDIVRHFNDLPRAVENIASIMIMLSFMGLLIFSWRDIRKQSKDLLIVLIVLYSLLFAGTIFLMIF